MLIVFLLLLPSLDAAAETALEKARAAYRRGEFRVALLRLKEAQRSVALTDEDAVAVQWYRAACFYAQGKRRDAETSFDALLQLRPLYEPDPLEAPPDLRAAFRARAQLHQERHGVQFGSPRVDGVNLVVPVQGNLDNVGEVAAFVRATGEVEFGVVMLKVDGPLATGPVTDRVLWQQAGRKGSIDLALEARTPRGVPLSRQGDSLRPLRLLVTQMQADAALAALPDPDAPVEEPAAETAPSNPLHLALAIGGGGLMAGGGLLLVVGLAAGVAALASWGTYAWSHERIRTHDKERETLLPIFFSSWAGGVSLPAVGLVSGLAALGIFSVGVLLLVLRVLLH